MRSYDYGTEKTLVYLGKEKVLKKWLDNNRNFLETAKELGLYIKSLYFILYDMRQDPYIYNYDGSLKTKEEIKGIREAEERANIERKKDLR